MKYFTSIILLITLFSCSTKTKYELTSKDKTYLNKVIDSMYEIDQGKRLYLSKIDSIYGLSISRMSLRSELKKALGDKYESYLKTTRAHWVDINNCDSLNTIKLIGLTKKYVFPNNKRTGVYKSKAYFIFVHSPKEYFEELRSLINKEYNEGRITEYKKEYIFWHLDGTTGQIPRSGENGKAVFLKKSQ